MSRCARLFALVPPPGCHVVAVGVSLTAHVLAISAIVGAAALMAAAVVVPPRVQEIVLVEPTVEPPSSPAPVRTERRRPDNASRPVAAPRAAKLETLEPERVTPPSPRPEAPAPEPPRLKPPTITVESPSALIAPAPEAPPVSAGESSTVDMVTLSPPTAASSPDGQTTLPPGGGSTVAPRRNDGRADGAASFTASVPRAGAAADEGPAAVAFPRYNHNAKPAYPRRARLRGEQGTVLLSVHVTEDGRAR